MNRRSGSWTLGEFVLCDVNKKSSDKLTWSDWGEFFRTIGRSYNDFVDIFFLKSSVSFPIADCIVENENLIVNAILHHALTLKMPSFYENLDGVLAYDDILEVFMPEERFQYEIYTCCRLNDYKWRKLYDTLNLTYDPISNYDRTETTTVTRVGTDDSDLTRTGSEKDVKSGNNVLSKDGSENYSKSGNDGISYGGTTTTTPTGSTTTTHKNSAFNEPGELTTETEDTTTYNGMSTVESFTNRKDTTTYDTNETTSYENRKDSNTYNESTEHSFSDRKDSTHSEMDHTEKTQSNIKGNIGVTTTQQMIVRERDVALFNWVNVVADDIVSYICKPEYFDPTDYYRCKEMGGGII